MEINLCESLDGFKSQTYGGSIVYVIGLADSLRVIVRGVPLDDQHCDGLREAHAHRIGIEDGQEAHNGQDHSLREYEICKESERSGY